jgi:hypothetical protein
VSSGIHGSDIVHEYLSSVARETQFELDEIEPRDEYDGEVSYGSIYDLESLLENINNSFEPEYPAEELTEELDEIYRSIKTTVEGNKKLDGLNALRIGWDKPKENRTWREWKKDFRDKNLIDESGEVTKKGQIFLEERLDRLDTGEAYRTLSTKKGYGNEGKKIELFLLQPLRLTHGEQAEITGMNKRTVTSTISDFKDTNLLDENENYTPSGGEVLQLIEYQLENLDNF